MSTTSTPVLAVPQHGYADAARRVRQHRETQLASLWSCLLREAREHLVAAQCVAAPSHHLTAAARLLQTMAGVVENRRAVCRSRRGQRAAFNSMCAYADQLAHALTQIEAAQANADRYRYAPQTYLDIQDVKRELPEMGQTAQIALILGYDPCLAAWLQG